MNTKKTQLNFNQLTPAETERLAILAEEMGEVAQIVGKILRHGYESKNPDIKDALTNRQNLQKELADIFVILEYMFENKDIEQESVFKFAELKKQKIKKWLHHQ